MKYTYNHTMAACHLGGISQAIINNYAPLLFLTFQRTYDLELEMITLLVTFNFLTQLVVDILAAKFVDRIGYRPCIVAAQIFCALGLVSMAFLPELLPPYAGLLAAVMIYAVGGGLIEVMISPIAEACPSDNKSAAMSLLHSSYCWGTVATITLSTLLFVMIGVDSWQMIAVMWALVPGFNALLFSRVPLAPIVPEGKVGMGFKELLGQKMFWILIVLMVCSGASEQSMVQWASTFAESSLHVSKTIGDLAGPCFFSVLMGISRVMYAGLAGKVRLERYMTATAVLCAASYILAVLPIHPLLNLLGCGICGFSVGLFWPGTFSLASARCPLGGTVMFGLLALGGDLGCSLGPTVVGLVSGTFGDELKAGLSAAIVFPVLIILGICLLRRQNVAK